MYLGQSVLREGLGKPSIGLGIDRAEAWIKAAGTQPLRAIARSHPLDANHHAPSGNRFPKPRSVRPSHDRKDQAPIWFQTVEPQWKWMRCAGIEEDRIGRTGIVGRRIARDHFSLRKISQ